MAGDTHTITHLHARSRGNSPTDLDRILDAALDLARAEAGGVHLDPDEKTVLDCCDQIAGLRDIAATETGHPMTTIAEWLGITRATAYNYLDNSVSGT